MTTGEPHVTLVLATYNAMPELQGTFQALAQVDYTNFSIVVQDGASTDGTYAFLDSQKDRFEIDMDSRPDEGVSQAYARAIERVGDTDYAVIIAADEQIMPHFLKTMVGFHAEHPEAAVIYSAMDLVASDGSHVQRFQPGLFNLPDIMNCTLVPPILTCMFNVRFLGPHFRYGDSTKTCMDYEFWLRTALAFDARHFVCKTDVLASALADRTSMSFRAESYVQFARDKTQSLATLLEQTISSPTLVAHLFHQNASDIYCWAADMVLNLEGPSQTFVDLVSEAVTRFSPPSDRVQALVAQSEDVQIWMGSDRLTSPKAADLRITPEQAEVQTDFDLGQGETFAHWESDITIQNGGAQTITTGPTAWSYAWQLALDPDTIRLAGHPCWIALDLDVSSGRLGIGLLEGTDFNREVIAQGGRQTVYCAVKRGHREVCLVVRNAAHDVPSVGIIYGARLVKRKQGGT